MAVQAGMTAPPHTVIRTAVAAGLPAICDVHSRARATYYAGHLRAEAYAGPAELARQRDGLARAVDSPERVVLCAVRERRIAGFAALGARFDGDTLVQFHVDPRLWRSGTGTELHRGCVEVWQSGGLRTARLEVFGPNPRARAFYARQGWTEESVEGDHVVMRLAVAGQAPAAVETCH